MTIVGLVKAEEERQIDAIVSILSEADCLPYMSRVRDIAPDPGPLTDDQKKALGEADRNAEDQNRVFARSILEAIQRESVRT